MYERLALLAALLTTLSPVNAHAAGSAHQEQAVTTSLSFLDPLGEACDFYRGQLRARFRATPSAEGGWTVEATFRPIGLLHLNGCFNPPNPSHVHGTGSAAGTVAAGELLQISAPGLRFEGRRPIGVVCTISVGSDGSVTVHELWLEVGILP